MEVTAFSYSHWVGMKLLLNVHIKSDPHMQLHAGELVARSMMMGIDFSTPEAQAILNDEWAERLKGGELDGLAPWLSAIPENLGHYAVQAGVRVSFDIPHKPGLGTANGYVIPDIIGPAELEEK